MRSVNVENSEVKVVPFTKDELDAVGGKGSCRSCRGLGHDRIVGARREEEEDCQSCFGSGVKTMPCGRCSPDGGKSPGSGKIVIDDKLVPCITCGTCENPGFYVYRGGTSHRSESVPCRECNGTGKVKRVKSTNTLYKGPVCQECKGTGRDPKYRDPKELRDVPPAMEKLENLELQK